MIDILRHVQLDGGGNLSDALTITVGDQRINISEAGIWVDILDGDGNVQSSFAKAWEELEDCEVDLYMELWISAQLEDSFQLISEAQPGTSFQLVTANSVPWIDADLPALMTG